MKNPMEARNLSPHDSENQIPLENIQSWQNKGFHERLGVSRGATEDEINKAFKKLSKKYHPDTVSNNESIRANYQEVQKLLGEAKISLTGKKGRIQEGDPSNVQDVYYADPFANQEYRKPEFKREPYTTNFTKEILEDLKSKSLDFILYKIKKSMSACSNLYEVTPKEVLTIVEQLLKEDFVRKTTENLATLSIEEASSVANEVILRLSLLGIHRNELLHLVEHLQNKEGKKLGLQVEFSEEVAIRQFAKDINQYIQMQEKEDGVFIYGALFQELKISTDILEKLGVTRDKLVSATEGIMMEKFVEVVKKQFSYKNAYTDLTWTLREISYAVAEFEKFGVEREKLEQVVEDFKNKKEQKQV